MHCLILQSRNQIFLALLTKLQDFSQYLRFSLSEAFLNEVSLKILRKCRKFSQVFILHSKICPIIKSIRQNLSTTYVKTK